MPFRRLAPTLALIASAAAVDAQPVPFPDMAPTVGYEIGSRYYDQSRIKPRIMVERALRALENAEISIDTTWSGGSITVNLAGERTQLEVEEPKDLASAMEVIERVRGVVDASDLPAMRRRDLDFALLNGALRSLDPHTYIWPPEPAKDVGEDIKGEFYGIGAFLNQEEGSIRIERVMSGLPAERAGVEDGDIILAVDGEKTAGLSLDQAVRRIKGPKGTTVTLTLERKGRAEPIQLAIVRNLVQIVSVRHVRIGDVGYIRMDEFAQNTAQQLYAAYTALTPKDGPVRALVFDLRFNGGGLLDQARFIGGMFLDKDQEIVRTVEIGEKPDITRASIRRMIDLPVVVLTSGATASAAEIVSGALQRNERAVVVGATSFGKGSVQNIRELRDGSRMRLTTQEYQLAGGVSIQDVGVIPDVLLHRRYQRKDGTVDLRDTPGEREGDDEFSLRSKVAWRHDPVMELAWLMRDERDDQRKQHALSARDFAPDQEARLAIELASGAVSDPAFEEGWRQAAAANRHRPFLLDRLAPLVAARAAAESVALGDELARMKQPVVWGPAPDPAEAGAGLSLRYDGPAEVKAGETVALPFTVANQSGAQVGRLYGVIEADEASPFWQDELPIGAVAPGGSTTGIMLFKVPPRMHAGEERFILALYADGIKTPLAHLPVALRIIAQPRPRFTVSWSLAEPAGGDGMLSPGETAGIRVQVRNDGDGPANKALLVVFKDNDPFVQLGANRLKMDQPLAPGATWIQTIPLVLAKEVRRSGKMQAFDAERITLQLRCDEEFDEGVDGRYRASFFSPLRIPVGRPLAERTLMEPTLAVTAASRSRNAHGERIDLDIRLDDDNPRYLALFQGEDKVDLQPVAALTPVGKPGEPGAHWTYRASFDLKEGLNALRIVAADQDEILDMLPVRVWGEAPPAADKAAK